MASESKIYFFREEVNYNLRNKRKIREWVLQAAENEDHTIGVLNIILTSDHVLIQLNKEYLRHITLTDIITFDLSETERKLTGDIYISIDRARENARVFNVTLNNELHRLMIHGVLHLMGYRDKTLAEKVQMRAKEEFYLSLPPWV